MPLAPAVALLLTDHTARTAALTIAGVDVLRPTGTAGNGAGVPIDSIRLSQAGPGGVSTLDCVYEDPLATGVIPNDGDEVVFWDYVNDVPLFGGWVAAWPITPDGIGRSTALHCVGYESILDWAALLADLVIPAGLTDVAIAIQSCVAAAEGTAELRAFSGTNSTQATPLSRTGLGAITSSITIPAGTSLREAARMCATAAATPVLGNVPANPQITVDFYRGLRAMPDSAAAAWATDFVNLTVTDTPAGALVADNLRHETDASQIVRGIYIKGVNAAGTGFQGDGTGRPGRIAYLEDNTIDTAAKLAAAQVAYLNQFVIAKRGSLELNDWTPTAGVVPGSVLVLTDAQTGATGSWRIMQILKTFTDTRQNWRITYGGLAPSVTRLLRRLTRPIRS